MREIYNLHNTRLPLNLLFRVPFWGMELAVKAGYKFLYYDLVKKKKRYNIASFFFSQKKNGNKIPS